jgi:hypothetical protein
VATEGVAGRQAMEPDLNSANVEKRDSGRHQGKETKDCSSSTSVSRQAPRITFTHSIQDRVLLINSDSVPVTIRSIPSYIYTSVGDFEGLVREAASVAMQELDNPGVPVCLAV